MRQSPEAEVDVPVNMQRQAPPVFRMGVQLHGFVVDVPVIMQRRPAVPQDQFMDRVHDDPEEG